MVELITGLTSAIDIVKRLNLLNEKIKNADIKILIANLNIELANAKNNISELIIENQELKNEIIELKNTKIEKLQFKDGAYYDSVGDGPFCSGCYDSKKSKIRLIDNDPNFKFTGNYLCPVCGNMFNVKG
jgi:hypothetical protein